ncbi:hypothetical protein ACFPVX_01060 [Cohnella faecalis]|uniref:Uncharacterized protein n=1 Tax=Cohnella faecalis TaxID=2315694 RepID=A0A398CVQ3_9BACL|nr:hypothetical protein [Cohnella faecalis]RIE04618.1 hypothetical protein D3H35_03750 [Cohnella faecalis]
MKLGSFIMGGLAGAALAVVVKRSPMLSAACAGIGRSLSERMSGMKEKAMNKTFDMSFSGGFKRWKGEEDEAKRSSHSETSSFDLEEISRLASKDSSVKSEINEILDQNGQHHI